MLLNKPDFSNGYWGFHATSLKKMAEKPVNEGIIQNPQCERRTKWTKSRTGATGSKLQSVRFWLIKGKRSRPATGLEVGAQSTGFLMIKVDKHKLDGLTLSRWQ